MLKLVFRLYYADEIEWVRTEEILQVVPCPPILATLLTSRSHSSCRQRTYGSNLVENMRASDWPRRQGSPPWSRYPWGLLESFSLVGQAICAARSNGVATPNYFA